MQEFTKNLTAYGGSQKLRQVVLFVWLGNPIVYKGNTFMWEQGRKLVSGTLNGNSFTYSYDGNGMRYEKVVDGVKTHYYYDGSQLLMESKNGSRTWYIYGVTGIEGMIVESGWQDSIYYFDKNTLGDVVAIRGENGNIVSRYEYDAWDNCTVMNEYSVINTSSSFIGISTLSDTVDIITIRKRDSITYKRDIMTRRFVDLSMRIIMSWLQRFQVFLDK